MTRLSLGQCWWDRWRTSSSKPYWALSSRSPPPARLLFPTRQTALVIITHTLSHTQRGPLLSCFLSVSYSLSVSSSIIYLHWAVLRQQTVILQRGAFLPVAAMRPVGRLCTAFCFTQKSPSSSPSSMLPFRFAWFRPNVFLAAAGLCELHFRAITDVSVGTNCPRALSPSFYVWQSVGDLEFVSGCVSQASLSSAVSFSLFSPRVSLFLFVYNSPFHSSDVRKMKFFCSFERLL